MNSKMKMIGIYPGNAVAYIRKLYDELPDDKKLSLLLDQKELPQTIYGEIPKEFNSRKTMDICASELLGLGVAGSFYNETGRAKGRSFQVAVGVDDASKAGKETTLSDGAIWENEKELKMPFQQVMVQGFYPKSVVSTEMVIKEINKKIQRRKRGDYPEHCGLIINIFSTEALIDLNRVARECELSEFNRVFCIIYNLPLLSQAAIYPLEENWPPEQIEFSKMNFNLSQYEHYEDWRINPDHLI